LNYYKIDLNEVFYINKEFDIIDEIQDKKDLNSLFETINTKNNIKYIIIDEIQNIESWEKFIL
jgi:predicted AAA+ superfamily ATPase